MGGCRLQNTLEESSRTACNRKILCVDQFVNMGGAQRSLLDLLPAFAARGWYSSVAIPGEGPFAEMIRRSGFRTHSFAASAYSSKKKPLWQLLRYGFKIPGLVEFLADVVERENVNLLYINGPRLVPPAAWVAWRKGLPLVFHLHNRLLQNSAVALTGQALELANAHVIACCRYVVEPLREYIEQTRLHIIYDGVANIGVGGRRRRTIRTIGVVGRIETEKGQLEFTRAAKLVAQELPDCRFLVVGAPMFSDHKYFMKVVANSRELPIEFIDWQHDIAQIYSKLDLLVVPSSNAEATTRVIPEAFSARLPVVAFAAGGIPEILADEVTGFAVTNMTPGGLAKRIVAVAKMEQEKLDMVIDRAREVWRSRFTLRSYSDSVCQVLADAMIPKFAAEAS